MKLKYIKVMIFILIAALLSVGIVSVSLSFTYKQIEYKEVPDQKNSMTPKLYIEGNLSMKTKEEIGNFKVKYVSDTINLEKYATLKMQGSSSLLYEKKNYTIKFYEDENCIDKFKVDFGWGRESKYVLKANWIDKTHSRNIVTARIASQIQQKYNLLTGTPNNGLIDGFPIEVYLNNEFYGLYTLNIPKDEWLYNMDKNNKNHIALIGEIYSQGTMFQTASFVGWENVLDDISIETQEKLLRLSNFIINSTDQEFKEHFDEYLNLDSTLTYYIMCTTFNIDDNIGKNFGIITYDGKVWYPTLYDLDTSFGTYYTGLNLYDYKYITPIENNKLFERVGKIFGKELADRYFELRKNILSEQNICNEIDKFYSQINISSLEKERNRWTSIPGYEITQMKEYMNKRLPFIDNLMKSKYPKTNNKTSM